MRRALLLVLLLSACRAEEPEPPANGTATPPAGLQTYAGAGRDRMCLDSAAGRAGLITYGEGDANCSLRGTLAREGERLTIVPEGDAACRLTATLAGAQLTLGPPSAECAYYCGPGADLAGQTFRETPQAVPVTDLVGDPLC